MKISYNWLKNYINTKLSPEEISKTLTDCGLEVESIEKFQTIKGGLEGIVIGEVKTRIQHPNADRLSVTTVDVGGPNLLQIVCGAPNVAAGQKVVVAQVGCTLYPISGEPFQINKSKIRGEVSEGMICAEDEIGLGKSHAGIMVLETTAKVGTPAKEYFKIEDDAVFEIGLTPNRSDAASHIGVARDLIAALHSKGLITQSSPTLPNIDKFKPDEAQGKITIEVQDSVACPRYTGLNLNGIKVQDSPEWLQARLRAIGIRPINNIVDITNFVMLECGQPLHAFDADKIAGSKIQVKKLSEGSAFKTLDDVERKLSAEDLMICDASRGLCIAGVFGGIESGISEATTNVFLESAYFDPVHVRKTGKRHGLKTDASFRFERGTDPNMTVYAITRAALLIKEIAGGKIRGNILDLYPTKIEDKQITYNFKNAQRLIGMHIDKGIVKEILNCLGVRIVSESETELSLAIPPFKVDVQKEVDIVEEVLRIYGYNNVPMSGHLHTSLSYSTKPNSEKLINTIADYLVSQGFCEMMNLSLTNSANVEAKEGGSSAIPLLNPLSSDLDILRTNLLFNGLETIAYNKNRKQNDLKLFEFGKTYHKNAEGKYTEELHLSILITGRKEPEQWNASKEDTDFYYLKSVVGNIISRLGIDLDKAKANIEAASADLFSMGTSLVCNGKRGLEYGLVKKSLLKKWDIKTDIFYADFTWEALVTLLKKQAFTYKEVPKYPEVKRDLSMLLDKKITFTDICNVARNSERQLLKDINIFDVYEGDKIDAGKKSYAVSFILLDEEKTLTDKQIDKTMERIMQNLEKNLGAVIRKN